MGLLANGVVMTERTCVGCRLYLVCISFNFKQLHEMFGLGPDRKKKRFSSVRKRPRAAICSRCRRAWIVKKDVMALVRNEEIRREENVSPDGYFPPTNPNCPAVFSDGFYRQKLQESHFNMSTLNTSCAKCAASDSDSDMNK